jgi:hypothetical protein
MRSLVFVVLLASAPALAQTAPSDRPPTDAPAPAATATNPSAPADTPPVTSTEPAPAPAGPTPRGVPVTPTAIVLDDLPAACRELGKLAQSPSRAQSLSARISLGNCIVEQKLRGMQLCDCEQSVREIEAASQRSLDLFDEVFLFGDPTQRILARQALGDLLASLSTRMLATVPPLIDNNEAAVALRDTRLALLRPLIEPWLLRAQAAYTELDRIARENPRLAKNPAVLTAVRTSRVKLAQVQGVVAKR